MVKSETLSSDIDLIKEIEQLKLKQKLLVQALKEKSKKEEFEFLIKDMSSKLNFLVEIFKEANKKDDEETQENNKKFDNIINSIDEKFKKFEENLDNKLQDLRTSLENSEKVREELKLDNKTEENVEKLPPVPNFSENSKEQKNTTLGDKNSEQNKLENLEKKQKKKGLFSL